MSWPKEQLRGRYWVFDAALAERAAQELFADEAATKPVGSPATKKAKKG